MDIIKEFVSENTWAQMVAIAGALCLVANAVTMVLPSITNNKVYNVIMKILNTIAGNRGRNKNADEVKHEKIY